MKLPRAGDQGRGFAVVAGEVRNLAQRSGGAAKEIEQLIRESVTKVEKGTELVVESGSFLKEIAQAAKTTASLIAEIAAASDEQRAGMEQINKAIMELDSMTSRTPRSLKKPLRQVNRWQTRPRNSLHS